MIQAVNSCGRKYHIYILFSPHIKSALSTYIVRQYWLLRLHENQMWDWLIEGRLIHPYFIEVICSHAVQPMRSLLSYHKDPANLMLKIQPRHNQRTAELPPLSRSSAPVPAHGTPFFSFSVEIFPCPSVDFKGTISFFPVPLKHLP